MSVDKDVLCGENYEILLETEIYATSCFAHCKTE